MENLFFGDQHFERIFLDILVTEGLFSLTFATSVVSLIKDYFFDNQPTQNQI